MHTLHVSIIILKIPLTLPKKHELNKHQALTLNEPHPLTTNLYGIHVSGYYPPIYEYILLGNR